MAQRPTIGSFRRQTAKRLRANTTNAETMLWRHLRQLEIKGTHFRRQVPIGSYVADFACMAARLIIEIDGSQHGEAENTARDDTRTRWLQREGDYALKFWKNGIVQNPQVVLDVIS